MKNLTFVSAFALAMLISGASFALDAAATPTPTPTPTMAAKPTPAATPTASPVDAAAKAAKAAECSKEADAKGLTGKERKKFRAACKKGK
jgi:hypothetical protein